jgi:glycosyltransferase involved in cell wall biosynthesis
MRILYHHRTLGDGAEGIHIAEMVNAFRALGHEVRVLGLAADDVPRARRGWVARIRNAVPQLVFEVASVATNVAEYLHTRKAIQGLGPDFLYKRHARNDVGAASAARHAGVPVVLEVNCLFTGEGYREFEPMALESVAAAIEKRALLLADLRLAVSTPLAEQIKRLAGMDAVVMPNGADPTRFDPAHAAPEGVRARYGLGTSLVIGWTGVVREWHGLELLLEAAAALPDARVLVVGDGPARAAMADRARALGLGERPVITGRVPHPEVAHHVAAMDVAVVASDRTGVASPMKLLEYMAMERAIAAPAIPNIQDVVTQGEDGLLFAPGDVVSLAECLRRLATDAALRERLGRAARRTVLERRNWRRNAEEVVSQVKGRLS